jgi:hypothetical protein
MRAEQFTRRQPPHWSAAQVVEVPVMLDSPRSVAFISAPLGLSFDCAVSAAAADYA